MNDIVLSGNFNETMQLGKALADSGFFSDSKGASQAIVKILAGRELGFGPVASMTGVNIIKGKVALSANLIAASIKRSGRYNYRVTQMDNTTCAIDFYEGGEKIGTSTFTMEDAKAAGLAGDNWRKFPRNMLFARAISNGAKWYCPDLSGGPLYTPDELGQAIDGETGEAILVEAPAPQPKPAPEKMTADELVAKLTAAGAPMSVNQLANWLADDGQGWPASDNIEAWRRLYTTAKANYEAIVANPDDEIVF